MDVHVIEWQMMKIKSNGYFGVGLTFALESMFSKMLS